MKIKVIFLMALFGMYSSSFALVGRGYDNPYQTPTNSSNDNNNSNNTNSNYDSRTQNGKLGPDVEKEGAREERQEWNAWY